VKGKGSRIIIAVLMMGLVASFLLEYELIVLNPFIPDKAYMKIQVEDLGAAERVKAKGEVLFYSALVSLPVRRGPNLLTIRVYGANISQVVVASMHQVLNVTTNSTIKLYLYYPFILARLYIFPGKNIQSNEAALEVMAESR